MRLRRDREISDFNRLNVRVNECMGQIGETNRYAHTRMWENLSGSFLREVCRKYHYKDEDLELLASVAADIRICIKEKECFEIHLREDDGGLWMADILITLGDTLDHLQDKYDRSGELMKQWMLENISGELLMQEYPVIHNMIEKQTGFVVGEVHFWGESEEYPLEKIPEVLQKFHTARVTASQDYCLKPAKSVLYRAKLLERTMQRCTGTEDRDHRKAPGEPVYRICEFCPRKIAGTCEYESLREETHMA